MSANWLNWLHHARGRGRRAAGHGRMAMPVFAGQKLVVAGGSSGMGRQTAADVVARRRQRRHHRRGPRQGRGHRQGPWPRTARPGASPPTWPTGMQAERVCQQLAGEHADATLLVNAAGFFVPKTFLEHDGAFYDSYLELDRAIFFLTQTVARGMIAAGPRRGHRQHRQHVGPPGHRGHPGVGLLGGQGRAARADPQPGHGAGPAPDPGQRGRPGRRGHPDLRAVRPGRQAGRDACTASTASTRSAGPAPPATWPTPSPSCSPRPPAGSPAPSGTSTAASWPDATEHPGPPVRRPATQRTGHAPLPEGPPIPWTHADQVNAALLGFLRS